MQIARPEFSRRALIVGTAAVCGGLLVGAVGNRRDWWTIDLLGGDDPDAAVQRLAVQGEAVLIRAYDEALGMAGDPRTVARLNEFRAHHLDHIAALGGDDGDVAAAPRPGTTVAPATGEPVPHVPTLPPDAADLPWYFAEQEQRWGQQAATGAQVSVAEDLARLLALVAASETTHAAGWRSG